jgi:hypothetical protein
MQLSRKSQPACASALATPEPGCVCRLAAQDPLLCAQVHLQCCEWLCTREGPLSQHAAALEHLAHAAHALCGGGVLAGVLPEGSCSAHASTPQSTGWLQSASMPHSAGQLGPPPRHQSAGSGSGTPEPLAAVMERLSHLVPAAVCGAPQLDEAVRVCTLWSLLATTASARLQWALHAQACATRMAASALHTVLAPPPMAAVAAVDAADATPACNAPADDATPASRPGSTPAVPAAPFATPASLNQWLALTLSPKQLHTLSDGPHGTGCNSPAAPGLSGAAKSVADAKAAAAHAGKDAVPGHVAHPAKDSFTVHPLHCAHRSLAWLSVLCQQLLELSCMAQCVPVMWLQVALAARCIGRPAADALLAELANLLQQLGLSKQALQCSALAGAPAVVSCVIALD